MGLPHWIRIVSSTGLAPARGCREAEVPPGFERVLFLVGVGVLLAELGFEFRDAGTEGGGAGLDPGLAGRAGLLALAREAPLHLEQVLTGAFPFGPALALDRHPGVSLAVCRPSGDGHDFEVAGC